MRTLVGWWEGQGPLEVLWLLGPLQLSGKKRKTPSDTSPRQHGLEQCRPWLRWPVPAEGMGRQAWPVQLGCCQRESCLIPWLGSGVSSWLGCWRALR